MIALHYVGVFAIFILSGLWVQALGFRDSRIGVISGFPRIRLVMTRSAPVTSPRHVSPLRDTNASDKDSDHPDWENKVVQKGLTHIKYNKYAPTPEEAANMTEEEFRRVIYMRMKEAERERRRSGPIGNASSDDYLESLSRRKPPAAQSQSE